MRRQNAALFYVNPQPCVPINRSALAHKSANSEGSCRSSWPATENMAKAAETTTALLDERPEATKEKKLSNQTFHHF